jgi:hypothetical protein
MLDKPAAARASSFLADYAKQRGIYMRINYFNADHTHALTRFADEHLYRRSNKALERQFVSLDQSAEIA